jgi:hypothetical protein
MTEKKASLETDALQQVAHEIEGLCKMEDLVPQQVLWDRPPGLPSGIELLWMIPLVDEHVFYPAANNLATGASTIAPPDHLNLLHTNPCSVESLQDLQMRVSATRQKVIERIQETVLATEEQEQAAETLLRTILTHDRQVLAAFTERLYESGLGA